MKEATGELDMTVIVAILVAALASFFYFQIWPKIGQSQNTDCQKAVCDKDSLTDDGYVQCKVEDDGSTKDVLCKYKG